MQVSSNGLTAFKGNQLIVNAAALFAREDFMRWLNQSNAMTWHDRPSPKAGDHADVVVFVEPGHPEPGEAAEGTDSDMPEDIWHSLSELVQAAKVEFGWNIHTHHIAVRLVNM